MAFTTYRGKIIKHIKKEKVGIIFLFFNRNGLYWKKRREFIYFDKQQGVSPISSMIFIIVLIINFFVPILYCVCRWFMPINILCTFIIGSVLAWILIKVTRAPRHLKGLVLGCCAAGIMASLVMYKQNLGTHDHNACGFFEQETWEICL